MDPYTRLTKREIYRNPWVAVEVHDIVHPTGMPGEHVLIVTPPASAVLVVDGDGFIFARQPRFGARSAQVEVVKGGTDGGEDKLACAQRELREELGIEAERWQSLGFVYEIPSLVEERVAIFVASGIVRVGTEQEAVESIEPHRLSIDDAYAACVDGRIDDAVTLAALFRFRLLGVTGATGS
jgi:ADP-ribose pyrophosphatase